MGLPIGFEYSEKSTSKAEDLKTLKPEPLNPKPCTLTLAARGSANLAHVAHGVVKQDLGLWAAP